MGVQHHTLDVAHVGVVLQSASIEADLLAHLGNAFTIVLREDVQLEDALSHVGCGHQVDLKNLGLQVALVRLVAL